MHISAHYTVTAENQPYIHVVHDYMYNSKSLASYNYEACKSILKGLFDPASQNEYLTSQELVIIIITRLCVQGIRGKMLMAFETHQFS